MFNIDFRFGKVLAESNNIGINSSLKEIVSFLRDPMLGVEYTSSKGKSYFLDVEWRCLDESFYYHDENNLTEKIFEKGKFLVRVTENEDWDNPLYYSECTYFKELEALIIESLVAIQNNYKEILI